MVLSNMLNKHISLIQKAQKLQMEIIYKIQMGNHNYYQKKGGNRQRRGEEGEKKGGSSVKYFKGPF